MTRRRKIIYAIIIAITAFEAFGMYRAVEVGLIDISRERIVITLPF